MVESPRIQGATGIIKSVNLSNRYQWVCWGAQRNDFDTLSWICRMIFDKPLKFIRFLWFLHAIVNRAGLSFVTEIEALKNRISFINSFCPFPCGRFFYFSACWIIFKFYCECPSCWTGWVIEPNFDIRISPPHSRFVWIQIIGKFAWTIRPTNRSTLYFLRWISNVCFIGILLIGKTNQ